MHSRGRWHRLSYFLPVIIIVSLLIIIVSTLSHVSVKVIQPEVIQKNYEIYLKIKNVESESLTLEEFKHIGFSSKDIREILIYKEKAQ